MAQVLFRLWIGDLCAKLRWRNAVFVLLSLGMLFVCLLLTRPSFEETVAQIEHLGGIVSRNGDVPRFEFLPKFITDRMGRFALEPTVRIYLNDANSQGNHAELLSYIGRLPNVSEMYIHSSEIRDQDLSVLAQFRGLTTLNVTSPQLRGSCLRYLRKHNQLSRLCLKSEGLDDSVTHWAAAIPASIWHLELTGPGVADETVQQLSHLKKLRGLRLIRGRVTGSTLGQLQATTLSELDLAGNPVNDAAMNSIAGFSAVWYLGLNNTQVTDAGVRKLGRLPSLQYLHLANTSVTGLGFDQPGGFQNLQNLTLGGAGINDAGLAQLLKSPLLVNVDLSRTGITGAGFRGVVSRPLHSLNLSRTRINDQDLVQFEESHIVHLLLSGTPVSDEGVGSLLNLQSSMSFLAVDETHITSSGIHRLRSAMPHLTISAKSMKNEDQTERSNE